MRKNLLILLGCIVFTFKGIAQTTDVGNPISWNDKLTKRTHLPVEVMPTFDLALRQQEDAVREAQKIGPWRFGYEHLVDFNLSNSGLWETTPKGDRIWRIALNSPGAISMNIQFFDFYIPEGGHLHVYSPDKNYIDGAYTSKNNNENNQLGTSVIKGETLIVEYFEPASKSGTGRLMIGMVVHGYRDVIQYTQEKVNESGACNLDVICPAGDPWRDQIRSVARILVGGGLCSGTLVNNTSQDGTPYFLTADHCGPANMGTAVFRFNYDSPTCGSQSSANSTTPSTNHTINGSSLKAKYTPSDFGLIQLNSVPPTNYNVYYAGWDRTGATDQTVVGIHHPSGDVKKISFDDDPTTVTSYGQTAVPGDNTHIRIETWERNTTTEGGSSGSAIFNQDGRVVGQLHGGGAACGNTQSDWYGRFFTSWTGGGSAATRLRDWLDPANTATVLDGWDPNTPTAADDAGIQSITAPNGAICGASVTPTVVLKNFGSNALTSVTISYDLDGGASQTYNWTGNLASGATANVVLNALTLTDGSHTFNASTTLPNGNADSNSANDAKNQSFAAAANPVMVTVTMNTDNYGSETTWSITDGSGNTWASGGPYTDVTGGEVKTANVCLAPGCYTLTVNDSYGDGMCCAYGNGSFTVTEDATGNSLASGGTFTTVDVKQFCVTASGLTANFSASATTVCQGNSVNFTDLSTGGATSWNWTFTGGSPSSSSVQNPTNISYNSTGSYNVQLIVGDGSTTDTLLMTSYITVGSNPVVTLNSTNPTCYGSNNGSITSSISGGTANFSYTWSNTATTANLNNLSAGTYSVIVTDASGCTGQATAVLTSPTYLNITASSSQSSCSASDGSIAIMASGGTPAYMYALDGGTPQSGASFNNLPAGTYSISVIDNNGCVADSTADVTNPNAPSVTASATNANCEGECTGTLTANASGGSGNYTYNWNSGETIADPTGMCVGDYSVIVTDDLGCASSSAYTSVNFDNVYPTAQVTPNSYIFYIDQGATLVITNNSQNVTDHEWNFGDGTTSSLASPTHTYTQEGTYVVTYTASNNGCSIVASFNVEVYLTNSIVGTQKTVFGFAPNPTSSKIHLVTGELNTGMIRIMNLIGEVVAVYPFNTNRFTLDLQGKLSTGTYFIQLIDSQQQILKTEKLIYR